MDSVTRRSSTSDLRIEADFDSESTNASIAPPTVFSAPTGAALPEDIVHQLMYWSMISSGSEASVCALACTSKQWQFRMQSFAASPWRRDAQSLLNHQRATAWVKKRLEKNESRTKEVAPLNGAELKSFLEFLERPVDRPHLLYLCPKAKPAFAGDAWLAAFRSFKGKSLPLLIGSNLAPAKSEKFWVADVMKKAERALTRDVCLSLHFEARLQNDLFDTLMHKLGAGGRVMGLEFGVGCDISESPAMCDSLIDLMSGKAQLVHVQMESVRADPGLLLSKLASACGNLRHLHYISMNMSVPASYSAIELLSTALKARYDAGKPRIIVALNIRSWDSDEYRDKPLAIESNRNDAESWGMYFANWLPPVIYSTEFFNKVRATLGQGAVDTFDFPEPTANDDSSDSLVASSSDDEADIRIPPEPPAPRAIKPAGERKPVKKQDRCVIS